MVPISRNGKPTGSILARQEQGRIYLSHLALSFIIGSSPLPGKVTTPPSLFGVPPLNA